ncbi:hypothetical protein [Rudaea sp.]|uniref:hypothetical protein n=1 Tax=Rudaea sp. TaxID=2136325 RepID=UPI0032205622
MPVPSNSVLAGAVLLASALVSPAFAADRGAIAVGTPHADLGAVRAQRAGVVAAARATATSATVSKAAVTPSELAASGYRAYPASCFSDTLPNPANTIQPLPVAPSGVLYSRTVTLYEKNGTQDSAEDVTITIFRVACSSSGDTLSYNPDGGYVGATLMRIQRQAQYEGDSKLYPQFPDIRVAQGSIAFDNANFTDYVRVATEPNTVLADTTVGAPVINSTTYVLENYASPGLGFFYFNHAFTIRFDNGYQGGRVTISVPDYAPTQQAYPAAYKPMAINGYLTGAWYDPAAGSREGLVTQVFDNGDGATRTFFATWYTYDPLGLPFWLTVQTPSGGFPIGATQLTNVPVYYATGGSFAALPPPPSPAVNANVWGTMNVSFSDCRHIKFDFASAAGTAQGVPAGSGTRNWTRLGTINSLACQ